jgi:CubicO group peptidase (beta-lactamase class C family)
LFGLAAATLNAQSAPAYAGEPALARYAPAIERGRLVMGEILHRTGVPGMSVAVGVDGEIVWSEGFGYADLEQRVGVTEATKFRIGSVSKPITAAALGLLVERGSLDLDAPVQQYVPSFPEKRWPITTRQLAGHLAGIRHYNGEEFLSSERYETVLAGLEMFQDDTLLSEPGTRYSYSSYAWNLISAVVEGASGQDFLGFMRENVFEPLEMDHTVADHTDSIITHRTRFYTRTRSGTTLNAPYVDNSYKWSGGGFLANTEDLVRFGMAHLGDDFLQPETIELLWTSQRTSDGEATGYGIGWDVGLDYDGRRTASHGGGSVGGRTFLLILPDDGVVVAMVANSSAPMNFGTAWTIAEPFLAPPGPMAADSQPNLAGSYTCTAIGEEGEVPLTLRLLGSPEEYLGAVTWDDHEYRIFYGRSRGQSLRIIAESFWLTNLWLDVQGNRATGQVNHQEVSCSVG